MSATALDEKKDFGEFYLSDELLRALSAVGYKKPTPVQTASIPLVMAGIDLIVQSQTGTGKTAAFAIPILEMVEATPGTVEVLVLAPTRELAKQVCDEFERLGQYKDIAATAIYGGTSYGPQIAALKKAQVVCATPGRLLDLLKQGQINLDKLRFLIIDEADEMLSMGFDRDVRSIVDQLPEHRLSLLFSATISAEVNALAKHILFHPEFLTFSSSSVGNNDVHHSVVHVDGVSRARDLIKLIELEEPETAIIFANTKADTFMVHGFLRRHGYKAEVLNGDLEQKEREKTLDLLRAGKVTMLVATDVAARGIDITDLSHVINYTLPETPDVYVHRTGRTGRAGKKGTAISLVSNAEKAALIQIKKYSGLPIHPRQLPTTEQINAAKHSRALVRLNQALDALPMTLAYGAKLGLATQLIASEDKLETARIVAKLMALAELRTAVPAELPDEPAIQALSTPQEAQAAADAIEQAEERLEQTTQELVGLEVDSDDIIVQTTHEPVEDSLATEAAEVEVELEEPAAFEQASEPVEVAAAAESEEQEEAQEAQDGEEETERSGRRGRRRRGRRRGRGGDRAEASAEQEEAQEAVEAEVEVEAQAPSQDEPVQEDEDASAETSEATEDGDGARGGRSERRGRGGRRRGGRGRSSDRAESAPTLRPDKAAAAVVSAMQKLSVDMGRMFVNMGRNAFASDTEFLDFVIYMSGMDEEDFGKIELERNHAVVEVRQDYLYDIIHAINHQDWKGRTLQARQFKD